MPCLSPQAAFFKKPPNPVFKKKRGGAPQITVNGLLLGSIVGSGYITNVVPAITVIDFHSSGLYEGLYDTITIELSPLEWGAA